VLARCGDAAIRIIADCQLATLIGDGNTSQKIPRSGHFALMVWIHYAMLWIDKRQSCLLTNASPPRCLMTMMSFVRRRTRTEEFTSFMVTRFRHMVTRFHQPSVPERSTLSLATEDLSPTPYSIDREVSHDDARTLFLGRQRGVERPILIERRADVAAGQVTLNRPRALRLEHHGMAQPVDALIINDTLYSIMATGQGALLTERAPLTQAQAVVCGIDLASALSYLIHRDHALPARALTPSNVFITEARRYRMVALSDLLLTDCAAPVDETALVYDLATVLHASAADLSPALQTVLGRALEPISTSRFTSVGEFRRALLSFQ
jgi:hypothetical protein